MLHCSKPQKKIREQRSSCFRWVGFHAPGTIQSSPYPRPNWAGDKQGLNSSNFRDPNLDDLFFAHQIRYPCTSPPSFVVGPRMPRLVSQSTAFWRGGYEVYRPYAHAVVHMLKESKFRDILKTIGEFRFSKVLTGA